MTAVEFEDILNHVGGRGRWQWIIFFFASLSGFFNAFPHLGYVFLGAEADHWCAIPEPVTKWPNVTLDQMKNSTIPREIRDEKSEYSHCTMYDRNYSSIVEAEPPDYNLTFLKTKSCDQWNFDRSKYSSTIVTEWNLVCNRKPLLSTVQASYMAGVFAGCFIYGMASDRFGRRVAILTALAFFMTAGIITAFSIDYIMFIAFRFVIAMSAAGLFTSTFVLTTEIADPTMRCMFGIFFEIPFAIGYMILSGVAYLIRDWHNLQLAVSIPSIFMISYIWVLPESPRWLISKGRFEEALAVLKKAAKTNNKTLPPESEILYMMKACKENEEKSKHAQLENFGIGIYFSLFQRRGLRRILTVYFTWFVVSMVYYGLALNAKNLGDDVYLVNFLNGAVEIPAYILVYYLIMRGGRRFGYCGTFLAGGCACLLILVVQTSWVITTFAVLGKFCITATFAISYLFTAELFPTSVRNVALTSSSMCGRIGSILAPYIVDLVESDSFNIPMTLFGGLAVIAGILALFLPETNKRNMVENWTTKPEVSVIVASSEDNNTTTEDRSSASNNTLATSF